MDTQQIIPYATAQLLKLISYCGFIRDEPYYCFLKLLFSSAI